MYVICACVCLYAYVRDVGRNQLELNELSLEVSGGSGPQRAGSRLRIRSGLVPLTFTFIYQFFCVCVCVCVCCFLFYSVHQCDSWWWRRIDRLLSGSKTIPPREEEEEGEEEEEEREIKKTPPRRSHAFRFQPMNEWKFLNCKIQKFWQNSLFFLLFFIFLSFFLFFLLKKDRVR